MIRNKTLIYFFTSFFFITQAFAQIRDRASISYQGMSSDSGEKNIAEAWVSERWLLDQEGASLLQVGVQTRQTQLPDLGSDLPQDLYMLVPQANLLHSLSDTYTLIANLRLGAFSDLRTIDRRDFRAEGALVLDKFINDKFTFGAGLGRVSNFGRVIFIPLIHVVWTINEKWLLDAMLPGRFDIIYLPSPKFETGLSFNINGSRYSIETDQRKIDSIGVAQMNLGPFARYQIAPSLYLIGESGVAFARRMSLMDENTEVVEYSPNNEIYFRTGLQYRF